MNKIVVASVAAAVPTIAPAIAEQAVDPIFAALETFRSAEADFYANKPEWGGEISDEISDRWYEAMTAVVRTQPTTPAGLCALTSFAREMTERAENDATLGDDQWVPIMTSIEAAAHGMSGLKPWSPPAAPSNRKLDALWREREAMIRVRQEFYRDEFTSRDGGAELEKRDDELYNKYWEIQDEIRDLPPSMDQAAAISIIHATLNMEINSTVNDDDPCEEFNHLIKLLKAMRPSLTGAIRETVDRMFDNPDETMEALGVITG